MDVQQVMKTQEFKEFVDLVSKHTGRDISSISITKNTIIVDGYSYWWRSDPNN